MAKQNLVDVKAPKTPDAKKLGGQAQKKAQQRIKKFIKLAIILAIAAIIGLVVYFIMHRGDQPDKVVNELIAYAKEENQQGFKNLFTEDSQNLLESAWSDDYSEGSWKKMMKTLTDGKATVQSRNITETSGLKFADVVIAMENDEKETIHLRQENNKWKVTVNVPINPRALPQDLEPPPEVAELFELKDETQIEWWKQTADEAEEAQKQEDSKLAKKAKSSVKVKKPKLKLPKLGKFVMPK